MKDRSRLLDPSFETFWRSPPPPPPPPDSLVQRAKRTMGLPNTPAEEDPPAEEEEEEGKRDMIASIVGHQLYAVVAVMAATSVLIAIGRYLYVRATRSRAQ